MTYTQPGYNIKTAGYIPTTGIQKIYLKKHDRSPSGKKRVYSGNNCFSQIVVCGECGDLYRRVHWYIHGKTTIVWRCISRLDPASAVTVCTNRIIKEEWLKDITVKAFNQILIGKESPSRRIS
ncbi:MAG: zinc ribbon domain-containing protein [Eubacteriales bacterium]|nr:zinc ribbon domain-containing protein [Eubacteriales bacterium]